jgi:hypothetical protein
MTPQQLVLGFAGLPAPSTHGPSEPSEEQLAQAVRDRCDLLRQLRQYGYPALQSLISGRTRDLAQAREPRIRDDLTGAVVLKEADAGYKLSTPYDPVPYRVTKDGGHGRLYLEDAGGQPFGRPVRQEKVKVVHPSLLQQGPTGAKLNDPDLALYEVHRIWACHDDPVVGRFFFVSWTGYDPPFDSWVHSTEIPVGTKRIAFDKAHPAPAGQFNHDPNIITATRRLLPRPLGARPLPRKGGK